MKKFWLFIHILWLPQSLQGWTSHVLPIHYNTTTQKWNILLKKYANQWSDFRSNGSGTNHQKIAVAEFKSKAPAFQNKQVQVIDYVHDKGTTNRPKDDYFYLIDPGFIPQNQLGQNFVWTPTTTLPSNTDPYVKWALSKIQVSSANQPSFGILSQQSQTKPTIKTNKAGYPVIANDATTTETKPRFLNGNDLCSFMGNEKWPIAKSPKTVHFYSTAKPYYAFANTFTNNKQDPKLSGNKKFSITIGGTSFDSTERFFQAMKFTDYKPGAYSFTIKNSQGYQAIMNAASQGGLPATARKYTARSDWHTGTPLPMKFQIMMEALWIKFIQNTDLENLLINTNQELIIEDTIRATYDEYSYGAGRYYTGCNHLGQMLMHIRDELIAAKNEGRKPQQPAYAPHPPSFYVSLYSQGKALAAKTAPSKKNSPIDFKLNELGSSLRQLEKDFKN